MFKLETTQRELLSVLQAVTGAIRKSNTLPILGCVLFKSEPNGSLRVTGSDLDVEITVTRLIGSCEGFIHAALEHRLLVEILQTMSSNEPIVLSVDDKQNVLLLGAGGKFSLKAHRFEDFPLASLPVSFEETLQVSSKALRALFEKSSFAMAKSDLRYYLVGTLLVAENNSLSVATTDGHRLVFDKTQIEWESSNKVQVILPRKSVLELKKLLSNVDCQVEVRLSQNIARIQVDDICFVTKLLEGQFPDVTRVIPIYNNRVVHVPLEPLMLAIKRAAIIANDKFYAITMTLERDLLAGRLTVVFRNDTLGQITSDVDVEYLGESVTISLNINYLLDALPTVTSQSVTLSFADTLQPAPVLLTLPNDENYRYVVMPLRS